MKLAYHPLFFIEKCRIIDSDIKDIEIYNKWNIYYTNNINNYNTYKKISIEKRNMSFEISKEQWDNLLKQECYLCGYKSVGGVGLDRVDNTIRKYSIDNVKPCCGSCNIMKGELNLEVLKDKCKNISEVWKSTDFFNNIPIIKKEDKNLQTKMKDRKVWKAEGVYYTILNNQEEDFYEFNKHVLTKEELEQLCIDVKKDPKEKALEYLSKLLNTLKVRKQRLKNKG